MKKPTYPLKQVLEVKIKRRDEAEQAMNDRKKELDREKEKLAEREKERDKAKDHHDSKLNQLREALDTGTTSDEVTQMKRYIEVCQEKVIAEEKKVQEQQLEVNKAADRLEEARLFWIEKRKEVDKIEMHQELWEKEIKQLMQFEENKEQDELGGTMFLTNLWKSKSTS